MDCAKAVQAWARAISIRVNCLAEDARQSIQYRTHLLAHQLLLNLGTYTVTEGFHLKNWWFQCILEGQPQLSNHPAGH